MLFINKRMKSHISILLTMLECAENLMWKILAKKLHIVACELHHIHNIVYNIGCPL
jgi:hypothetical protein